MAVIYLSSVDGSDADNGSTWALAKATLAAALTAAGAGGTVYVDNAHAESQGSAMTLTSPGTSASPVMVLCASRASGAPPTTLATTATVTTTTTFGMDFAGVAYCYGVTFRGGTSTGGGSIAFLATTPWYWRFEQCAIELNGSGSGARITFGANSTSSDDQRVELVNSSLKFANASQGVLVRCPFRMEGGSVAAAGTAPTTLFLTPSAGNYGDATLRGVNLSGLASGTNLVLASAGNCNSYTFENCKLGSSVSITTGSVAGQGGVSVRLVNCDSADTNYRYYKQTYQGTITQETTIVRDSGASDGTTPVSRKMVTTANSKMYSPLESDAITFWNETTGSSVTATVEVVTDNVTLTDAEAWIEVEYLGTSGFPVSSFASDRAADVLATPANQTSSSVTWTTTGLGTPVKQKLAVSFTPAEKGPVKVRVMLAKASTTMYVCPKVDVT